MTQLFYYQAERSRNTMNEAVVNSMSIINGLNKVDGFDPSAFLRRLTGENGEEQF